MASAEELAIRDDDLEVIEDDSMIWNGTTYPGIFTEFRRGDTLEIGGYVRNYDASFYVRTAALPALRPNVDDRVVIQGKTLQIVKVHTYPDDIALELELSSPAEA
jgi:hypothetical protein